jgi:hypothetical protein
MADFELATDPPVIYSAVGRCIYCTSDSDRLGDEHIVPYALNGTQVLPLASCPECAKITSYLDGFISREVFWHVRTSAGMRTRRTLPTKFPLTLIFADGHKEEIMAPAHAHPASLLLPKFASPTMLSGEQPDGNFRFTTVRFQRTSVALDELVKARGAVDSEIALSIKPRQFSRVLAKIAHSYAVAQLGLDGFRPLLLDLIHKRNVEKAPELIGCETQTPPAASGVVHELSLLPNRCYVAVRIRLFASTSVDGVAMPVYLVVAGRPLSSGG